MVHHGLSAPEALVAATQTAARALGLGGHIGTIEPGRLADLLVTDGDPLARPGLLRDRDRIWLVFQLGAPVAGAALERVRSRGPPHASGQPIGPGAVGDLVVLDGQVALDEEAVVLGIEDRGLDVVAREAADRVQRVPEREGDELGPVAVFAAQHPRAAVARGRGVGGQAGLADVGDVGVGVLAANGAPPDASDHRRSLGARPSVAPTSAGRRGARRCRVSAPQATLPLSANGPSSSQRAGKDRRWCPPFRPALSHAI